MPRTSSDLQPVYTDLVYKAGAVGLAVIVWFFSISNSLFDADVELPIEIRNIREGKALGQETPRKATLRFHGTGRSLAKLFILLPFHNAKLVLDLERVQQRHVFYLDEYLQGSPQRISIPIPGLMENLTFVEVVSPDSIEIVLGDYKEKLVRIIPQVTLDLAAGYTQVGATEVVPPQVTVMGVIQAVDKVALVRTMRRTYRNVAEPLRITVGLLHPDPAQVLEVSPVVATLKMNIQMIGERRLEEVPVKILNIPGQLNVTVGPSTVALTVTGGVDYLADLDKELVEVFVDYRTQWSPTDALVEPQVRLGGHLLEYRDLVPSQLEIITSR